MLCIISTVSACHNNLSHEDLKVKKAPKPALAIFKLPPRKWDAFKRVAASEGLTASEKLRSFVDVCVKDVMSPTSILSR
jgi:hypothetical protein